MIPFAVMAVAARLTVVQLLIPAAAPAGADPAAARPVILATTTSTYDSGLLDDLIPPFERASGLRVTTIAVGSGKALALAERGEVDVVLAHSPEAEEQFMARGAGVLRRRMMYNDFVLAGPGADPAGAKRAADLKAALKSIVEGGALFVSRGDESGTHQMEKRLWRDAGVEPAGKNYLETGQGMGATLSVAAEKGAYTLTDRATLLAIGSKLRLTTIYEGDPALRNIYHVIVVNPKQGPRVNAEGAQALVRYLLSAETLERVRRFGLDRFGRSLFIPDAEAIGGPEEKRDAAPR